MKSLNINLETTEKEAQLFFRILPTQEQLPDWILHLLLIRRGIVDTVKFESGNNHLLISAKKGKRRQASYPSMMLDLETKYPLLQLTDEMLDNLIHFYLTCYHGDLHPAAHIDVVVDNVDSKLLYSRYALTFDVPQAKQ